MFCGIIALAAATDVRMSENPATDLSTTVSPSAPTTSSTR
ncbi:hypothetical protein SVIOM342S_03386 [Streptomyces violaceorubidus]